MIDEGQITGWGSNGDAVYARERVAIVVAHGVQLYEADAADVTKRSKVFSEEESEHDAEVIPLT